MTGQGKYGHTYPHLRRYGQEDDRLYEIRRKFLRARCQARYWRQAWSITWPQWQSLFDGVDITLMGTRRGAINVSRINRSQGWHRKNVKLMARNPHTTQQRGSRRRRNPQLESLWQQAKAIKRLHHFRDTAVKTRDIYQRLQQQQEGTQ